MTIDDKFKLSIAGDSLRALNTTNRTPDDMWEMLKEIERLDLKAEVKAATKPRP
jgi:hypothetical protein